MKKIINDKKYIIICLMICFILIFFTNSYAGIKYKLSDESEIVFENMPEGLKSDYFICKVGANQYNKPDYEYLMVTYNCQEGTILYGEDIKEELSPSFFMSSSIEQYKPFKGMTIYKYKNNNWILQSENISNVSYNVKLVSYYTTKEVKQFDFHTYSIKDYVVFQGAPLPVEQITIPAIQQVQEIPQTMEKVMKILIPIGLIILSIGLVIFLMRLVILQMT